MEGQVRRPGRVGGQAAEGTRGGDARLKKLLADAMLDNTMRETRRGFCRKPHIRASRSFLERSSSRTSPPIKQRRTPAVPACLMETEQSMWLHYCVRDRSWFCVAQ